MRKNAVASLWVLTVALGMFVLCLVGAPTALAQDSTVEAEQPVVRFLLFYGESCPHCHDVMDDYLPGVYEKYGDQVEYQYIEVWSDTDKYLTLLGLEMKLGVPEESQGAVPALVIGDKVLVGSVDIPGKLETYIDEYLAQGGVDYPSLDDLPEVVLPTPEPAVQMLVFYDPNHADFEALNNLIADLAQEYGGLQPYAADVTQTENAQKLAELNTALGIDGLAPGTPQIVVGGQILTGLPAIQSQLPQLVEGYVGQGGVSLPQWEDLVDSLVREEPTATTEAMAEATASDEKPIYMAYFEQAGCQECARTSYDLKVVESQYPQLVVESFSMEEAESKTLNEWMSEKYGVPEEKRLSTPMLFVGQDVLIGTDATLNNLMATVGQYSQTGAERTWDDFDASQAEQSLVERFRSFGVLTVLGAGLIDGLNPCAFATLIFFISYLTFTGRRGRDILFVGIAFALGVFLTYLLVGVGLAKDRAVPRLFHGTGALGVPAHRSDVRSAGHPDLPRLFQSARG